MTPSDCLLGKGYLKPASGDTVDSSVNTQIAWDTSCFNSSSLDIYLYALSPDKGSFLLPIHGWRNFPSNAGQATVKLMPRWWINDANTNQTEPLYLNIVPSGNEPWDTANPTGPSWNATYTAPGAGKNPPDDALPAKEGATESVISVFYAAGGLTAGGKAAAIICPLIVVSVLLGIYIRKLHINRNNKTAVWAEKMDQRMSRVSVDWMAGGDGSAGPRPGSRPASYMQRPSGDAAGMAGRGTAMQANDFAPRGMSLDYNMRDRRQSRISFAHETQGDRVSRISFGNPSSQDHSRGHKTSASLSRIGPSSLRHSFYDGTAPAVPPLNPAYRESSYSDAYADGAMEDIDELAMSPTQHQGAMPLSSHQLDHLQGNGAMQRGESADASDREFRDSVLKYPAISMISSGQDGSKQGHGDMFAAASLAASDNEHGGVSRQTGMAPAANFSSPDEALKQYAALRAGALSPADSQIAGNNGMMRTLYTPEPTGASLGHRAGQGSVAGSQISEDAAIGYNEAGYSQDVHQGHAGGY